MAVRADVRYVEYRVDGNTARKVETNPQVNTAAPEFAPIAAKTRVVVVDPVAVAGIIIAVVMILSMVVGLMQYRACLVRSQRMSEYVQQLEEKNQQLSETYHNGYDVEEIRDIALSAGMVPAESVETIHISLEEPSTPEVQMSFWQSIGVFLAGIFA